MRILADTHILVWAFQDSPKLTDEMRSILLNPENSIYYSTINVWEVALKHDVQPSSIDFDEKYFGSLCEEAGFLLLTAKPEHIYAIRTLSKPDNAPRHKDPFDRLLLAQAKSEGMKFMTNDNLLPYYNEPCIISV